MTGVVPWVVIKVEVVWTTVYTLFFNEGKTCRKYLYLEIKKRDMKNLDKKMEQAEVIKNADGSTSKKYLHRIVQDPIGSYRIL